MFKRIKEEIRGFSKKELFFVFSAMACGFLICAEYAVVRPVANALFITSYSSSFLPYAWLVMVPLNFLVVFLYNRFLPRMGCLKMFLVIITCVICGNIFSALFLKTFHFLPFVFYVWKEIYILLMFQQLWSVIHATIDTKRAKYIYGFLFGIGGLGGMCGSAIPGFFAVKFGSENLLFLSLPLYALLALGYISLLRHSSMQKERGLFTEGKEALVVLKGIRTTPILFFILLIVIFMQTSSTVIDYQFNKLLEVTISTKDLRTEYTGKILGLINLCTTLLQFVGSFILLQFLGLKRTHFTIPFLLGMNALTFLFAPVFGVISFSYITIKSCDFSIFGIIKEILYIPLKPDEKFRAKAFIDVFAYRSAKAFASIIILLFEAALGASLAVTSLTWGVIVLCLLWSLTVLRLLKTEPRLA
ncbi:MAG: Npt1/Npt2 family nucleotide transporter [Chlamydiales bacterium]